MSSTITTSREMDAHPNQQQQQQQQPQNHKVIAACDRNQSTSISSSSSLLTNSSTSPSSSLTSISTSSPTTTSSISNSQSMRSVSICLNYTDTQATVFKLPPLELQQQANCDGEVAEGDEEKGNKRHEVNLSACEGGQPCSRPETFPEAFEATGEARTEANSEAALCSIAAPQNASNVAQQQQQGEDSSIFDEMLDANHRAMDKEEQPRDTTTSYCEAADHDDDDVDVVDVVQPENRIERSNSCSQAETNAAMSNYILPNIGIGSVSHESLANQANDDASNVCTTEAMLTSPPPTTTTTNIEFVTSNRSTDLAGQVDDNTANALRNSGQREEHQKESPPTLSSSSSARFFSSKLNTGSLWSLLSVGSNNSTNTATNEITQDNLSMDPSVMSSHHQQQMDSTCQTASIHANNQQSNSRNLLSTTNDNKREDNNSGNKLGSFFSRVQFKRNPTTTTTSTSTSACTTTTSNGVDKSQVDSSQKQAAAAAVPKQPTSHNIYRLGSSFSERMGNTFDHIQSNSSNQLVSSQATTPIAERGSRFRFNLKYIGSALLHKNFTLPMLEWIAKDIKRQTIRGAQSISQRQFTIPTRDIVLEIQAFKLTAISCKDGHCIFVHPMPCVSKYAQLQHDPTCFSYLIRDNKESPLFCHVFQAKSAHKVHDIFRAIREATTQTQICQPTLPPPMPPPMPPALAFGRPLNHISAKQQQQQQLKLSLPANTNQEQISNNLPAAELKLQQQQISSALPLIGTPTLLTKSASSGSASVPVTALTSQRQQQQQKPDCQQQATAVQFENSYQFEVMFVKKVKLHCRRVPASFVDDALETLKSFEVLKGGESKAQIKGIGKRIISASVDERQEYDETCQSPTPSSNPNNNFNKSTTTHFDNKMLMGGVSSSPISEDHRRGSSVSLNKQDRAATSIKEERESRSCQQSPTKLGAHLDSSNEASASVSGGASRAEPDEEIASSSSSVSSDMKKHQSMDCLKSIGSTIRSAKEGKVPTYTNDFSPYNTITSSDLNERIAAIPVVSSSVSLDHETRQKLARQVRETIMATAANIKKDVYASGDKLDSSASSKALDSLSCTSASYAQAIDDTEGNGDSSKLEQQNMFEVNSIPSIASEQTIGRNIAAQDHRRSSATASSNTFNQHQMASNNFDLFRRASARQVVKNRTMLLLIGKDELCTISIDKHQMLFSKSFNSIVHCLQGNNNKDHFGLICRDSGKINPNTESYAGFIFKCQSDKVVREIMGALKQVIYSSQHNYHGYNSPYNPLNAVATNNKFNKPPQQQQQQQHSPKPERAQLQPNEPIKAAQGSQSPMSLAAKRGFMNPIELEEAAKQNRSSISAQQSVESIYSTPSTSGISVSSHLIATTSATICSSIVTSTCTTSTPTTVVASQPKNLIKSMFCDGCPLYWYHRLCCDIESLPVEASKAIILRRIDSSLSEKEQDELYSRFSEFNIDSIDEHNEIFMSLLRHQCEKKQAKHSQSHSHLESMAKNLAKQKSISSATPLVSRQSSLFMEPPNSAAAASSSAISSSSSSSSSSSTTSTNSRNNSSISAHTGSGGHQRSGSSSGSLAFVIGQANANQAGQSIADASSAAMDNLKKAKNSISSSIENILKRRQSMKDDHQGDESVLQILDTLPTRSGSFKTTSRESRAMDSSHGSNRVSESPTNLKRSQSTSDYSKNSSSVYPTSTNFNNPQNLSWKDSISRTLNDDSTNPLVGLFRRRNSLVGPKSSEPEEGESRTGSTRVSTDCLSQFDVQSNSSHSPKANLMGASQVDSRAFMFPNQSQGGMMDGLSPSSMLSSAFWKKSIFDKIRQPIQVAQDRNLEAHTSSKGDGDNSSEGSQMLRAANQRGGLDLANQVTGGKQDELSDVPRAKRSREELRSLWRKAINEQITLLKMEKQNQRLQANSPVVECDIQRVKLNYKDISHPREMATLWDKLLKQDPTKKVEFVEVARMVRRGVPKQYRGEVWMFLMNQYQLRHGTSFQAADGDFHGDANQSYRSLLSLLSVQQHDIFVDIGRTFPSHPYYSQYLGLGQLSLFNLLKAYSLLDQEVGYCQGLSFVAGILLLHVDTEDEAFELMRHLLFNFGLRKQYLPSMNALHLQLYQMTRLLRDYEYELFNHFDHHDISPSLYAAPWFLTLFASQFPLGFVTRLFDLISLIGIEAIFRVSLNLLAYHRSSILACTSLESTMEYMKSNLVKIDDRNLVKIFDKSMSLDLRNKLIEYEIEYTFYCAEDKLRSSGADVGHHYHQNASMQNPSIMRTNNGKNPTNTDGSEKQEESGENDTNLESTSVVADATATVIIQHLLANNHLKSLRTN